MSQEKTYILDTNVLVHDPMSIFNFKEGTVGIPIIVLEELDQFKAESSERGSNTREVIRQLDILRSKGSLREGVALGDNVRLRVLFHPKEKIPCISPFKLNVADNEILLAAFCLKEKGADVRFVSKDLNARVKADSLGIPTQDYLKGHVEEEDIYKGWTTLSVPAVQLKKEIPDDLLDLIGKHTFLPNEFVLAHSQHNPHHYRVFRHMGNNKFKAVFDPTLKWPLKARNPQQLMALELLFDPKVQLVNLLGPAGTGKTFLALLAGLHQVLVQDEYKKMLISRPVIPLGRDIGYLPGDIKEKLRSWMLPVYDNMDFISHSASLGEHVYGVKEEQRDRGSRRRRRDRNERSCDSRLQSLDELERRGKLSLEAITYMRGRSIPYQYILIDEVQNLTPHEVKTVVSRAGEGSKIILAGDPDQIDSPYLTFNSNGLVIAGEKFKGQDIFGTVLLESSERSQLSKLAGELL